MTKKASTASGVEMGKVNRVPIIRVTQGGSTGCTQDAYDRIGKIVTTNVGSAETGGEKAATELRSLIQAIENCAIADSGPNGVNADTLRGTLVSAKAALANFRRSSQNNAVSSGVEGAHEGITADEKCVYRNDKLGIECDLPIGHSSDHHIKGTGRSREPEKLNNAQKSLPNIPVTCENCERWKTVYIASQEMLRDLMADAIDNALEQSGNYEKLPDGRWKKVALAESSLSSPPPTKETDV